MKPKIRILAVTTALALAWMPAPARAQQVLWGSPVGVDSATSANGPIDASFTFQVGAFFANGESGWAPTAANTAEWADHWLAADSAVYNEKFRGFTGACDVDLVFTGAQGYVWGFDSRSANGEWILMMDPAWKFPTSASALAFPPSWQTSAATVIIAGATDNTPGAPIHLRTAQVAVSPPPFVPSEQWLGMFFTVEQLAEPLISSWGADPDRDGMNNLLELAVGARPTISTAERTPKVGFVEIGGDYFLSLGITRAPNVAVILEAEVSSDMVHWESGAGMVTVVSEDPESLLIRDNVGVASEAERFIRLKVTLQGE